MSKPNYRCTIMIEFFTEVAILSFTIGGIVGAVIARRVAPHQKAGSAITENTVGSGVSK